MYEIYEKLRDEKGWKNTHVAELTGISDMTLSDWKKGKTVPKLDKYIILADLFNVSLDYIVRGITPDEYSESDARLVSRIKSQDGMLDSLEKFFDLSEAKKTHVIELINLLSE